VRRSGRFGRPVRPLPPRVPSRPGRPRSGTSAAALVLGLVVALGPAGAPAGDGGDVVVNSLGMKMVLVPAGRFRMGSLPGETFRQDEEVPRRVRLTRSFRIAATEVTRGQWLALMPHDRSPGRGDDRPVTNVSWKDAQVFCAKLSDTEGARYRLPTEAEWEYACRGWAEEAVRGEDLTAVAWFAENGEDTTHPVGTKAANGWGLFDMLGNVAEWTLDAYGPYPLLEAEEDPAGPADRHTKVVRGGAYRSFPPALRCAARTGSPESYQLAHVGFRVVQETPR
jgi:formylglycine-generating enzyme required for sulfatase activity